MKIAKRIYCRAFQTAMRIGDRFMPWRTPQLLEGPDSIDSLPLLVKNKGIDRVLLVTDKTLMELKLTDSLIKGLADADIRCIVYSGVQPNPTVKNVEEALAIYRSEQCQGLIGFGGGSSIDCAKACGARAVRPNRSVVQMKGLFKVSRRLPPLFAVPTTSGTGSETTVSSVITDTETKCKYSINDLSVIPHYAILDPKLTVGLPKHITATTGTDAMAHAVEAYIGRSNNKTTRNHARQAVKLIFENLERAYNNGNDLEARGNMQKASYLAGTAFTRAYVGYVHAVAHTLSGFYGVPHGHSIAVILPKMLRAYGSSAYKPLSELADLVGLSVKENMTSQEKAGTFIKAIEEMNMRMDIPTTFSEIQSGDIDRMAGYADAEANPLYPVPKEMDKKELTTFIKTLRAVD